MATTKREVMQWIDEQLAHDALLRRQVEKRLNEMRLEQQLTALREARGLSQTQLAKMVGVSQPAIAKLESGKVKNLQVKTLVRMATALGARVTIEITQQGRQPRRQGIHRSKSAPRRSRTNQSHASADSTEVGESPRESIK